MTVGNRSGVRNPRDGRRGGWGWVAACVGAVVVAGSVGSWLSSDQPWWLKAPLSVWGIPTVAAGLVMAAKPERRTNGVLVATTGVTYYLSVLRAVDQPLVFSVAFATSYLWVAVLGHLVLLWARPLIGGRLYIVLTVTAYLAAVGTQTLRYLVDRPRPPLSPWWDEEDRPGTTVEAIGNRTLASLITVMFVIILVRWASASRLRRRVTLPTWSVVAGCAVIGFGICLTTILGFSPRVRVALTAVSLEVTQIAALMAPQFRRVLETWLQWRVASSVLGLERDRELLGRPVDLQRALGNSLGDPGLRIYYPVDGGYVDAHGRRVEPPRASGSVAVSEIRRGGHLFALLEHDTALADSRNVAESASAIAGLAIEATYLQALAKAQTAAIAASRRRLVTTAIDERRRIQRNLHDGAQQILFSVLALLDQAQHDLDTGVCATATVTSTITRAHRHLTDAIGELRRLSHGLYPSALTEYGLGAAVEALADTSPLPVDVSVPDRRWPGDIESTAYFIIAEAVTNTVKHARATTLWIVVAYDPLWLDVTVSDDGAGGAWFRAGGGLVNLRDRAAAVGGDLAVNSRAAQGTTVRARLPIAAPSPEPGAPVAAECTTDSG